MFPLHDACRKGDQKVVRYLISSGDYDPDFRDELDRTPLHCACEGSLDIVRFLCEEAKCDSDCLDYFGWTLLHFACQAGKLDIVEYLLEKHRDVNCMDNHGSTPLHVTCKGGYLDVVRDLVRSRCDVNARDEGGNTPLHISCHYGHLEVVEFLVRNLHCDVKVRNNIGDTPTHVAYHNRHTHVTSFLLLNQMLYAPDIKEASAPALYYACQYGDLDSVISLVIDQHVNIHSARITPSGDTALHIACIYGYLNIVSFLLNQILCDSNCKNFGGDIPLHIACRHGQLDIIKELVGHCNIKCQNFSGDTPLHVACNLRRMDIVGFLNEWCIQHDVGSSPLHIACRLGQQDIVQFLVCEHPFTIEHQDESGDTPLHIACRNGHMGIVRLLVANCKSLNCCNKQGDTPLHVATKCRYPSIARILLDETCEVNCQNEDGDTPLHISCQQGQLGVVVYLVLDRHCETNSQNKNKDTPLHIAIQYSHSEIVSFLVKQTECDINCQNKYGNTPLHVAAAIGEMEVFALQDIHGSVNLPNSFGNTPLHIACESGRMGIVEALVTNKDCNINCRDLSGNTPLHIACRRGDSATVKILLCTHKGKIDSECANNLGYTPAELTNYYKVIQMLSSYRTVRSHPLQAYVKLFVIGNPAVGKSTLIAALCKEIPKWKRMYLFGFRNRVSDVELHTAGIIPHTFHSKQFGNTVVYDFAGQYEYYSSHGAVIEKLVPSSPPLFLLVVDLREDDHKIIEKLNYWGNFITNHSLRSSDPPHVIVIASYADVVQSNGEHPHEKLFRILQSPTLRFASTSSFHFAGSVVTDCRKLISQELDELRSLLTVSCITLRSITDIDFRCHVLNTFLLEQFQGTVACTVDDISARVTQEDALLPSSTEQLLHVLSTLSDKGYSLLIKDSSSPEKSWVVLEKNCLLANINGTIFAPEHFRQHRAFSQSTGVVPLSKIREVFQEHNPHMIVGFLTQLEFCIEIDDQEALDKITFSGIPYDPSENYYFFPALVNVENPQDVCCPSRPVQNKCGWYLKCIMHDEFLTTRFLQVLVLRLAFSFALAPEHGSDLTSPVLTRRCSVWKHGIAWWNRDGIETIVEVGLQCQWVAVMMRSPMDMVVECSRLRSSLIQTVLKAKSEFCHAVKVSEAFIHPDFVQYPFSESEGCVLYSFNEIKTTIMERKTYAVDSTGKHPIKTEELLHFEPYADLTSSVINQLFNPENAETEVTDKFLTEFAAPEEVHKKKERFKAMIKPDSVMLHERYSRAPNDPVRQFIYLLQCLRDRCVTFKHFREELDKHSIFCGGNPLEVSHFRCGLIQLLYTPMDEWIECFCP